MIFARKTTWRSRLDLEYLDETSSRKVSSRQQHDDSPKRTRPLKQFADYASKETLGQVHAGGFLHYFVLKRSANFVSRLVGRGVPKAARVAEKLAAAVDRRSLREMRHLLFRIRAEYSAAHKRYARMQGFSSYANRIAIAHRQQNAL